VLVGYPLPPQPQGPISINNGKTTVVEFRNPYNKTVTFNVSIDNVRAFSVNNTSLKLDSKKTAQFSVGFKSPSPASGRLIITSASPEESEDKACSWTYFLKGVM
jgi:hypothetical protein